MKALTHAPMQKKARSKMLGPPDKLGTLYVSRDESGRNGRENIITIFVFILLCGNGYGNRRSVGKTKSDKRKIKIETIRSESCR